MCEREPGPRGHGEAETQVWKPGPCLWGSTVVTDGRIPNLLKLSVMELWPFYDLSQPCESGSLTGHACLASVCMQRPQLGWLRWLWMARMARSTWGLLRAGSLSLVPLGRAGWGWNVQKGFLTLGFGILLRWLAQLRLASHLSWWLDWASYGMDGFPTLLVLQKIGDGSCVSHTENGSVLLLPHSIGWSSHRVCWDSRGGNTPFSNASNVRKFVAIFSLL